MEDKSKIDKLFSDGLNDFEASPQSDSWARINATMEKKQQKKRGMYWRWASIAAAVILAFYTGYYFNDNSINETYPQTEKALPKRSAAKHISDKKTSEPNTVQQIDEANTGLGAPEENISSIALPNKKRQATKPVTQSSKNMRVSSSETLPASTNLVVSNDSENAKSSSTSSDAVTASSFDYNSNSKTLNPENAAEFQAEEIVASEEVTQTTNTATENTPVSDTDLVDDYIQTSKTTNEYTLSRFSVSAMASPTFPFTDITVNQSDETTQNNVKNEKLKTSYSYGLGLGYRVSKKLELQTGVMVNNWHQEASEIKLKITPSSITSTNTSLDASGNTSVGNVNFSGLNDPTNKGQFETALVDGQTYSVLPGLKESYQFVEIPIYLGYYLVDSKRWFVKLNLGLNSRFITQSDVTLVYADGTEVPYDDITLRTYSMQLIGGIGAGIKLGKHWEFGLHPTLLYGISKVNQHSQVDTYFHQMLIYSALSYRF